MSSAYIATPVGLTAPETRLDALNGKWHERALWLYLAVVIAHWGEHLVQAWQIWVTGLPRPESLGALGWVAPWLVKTEVLHWSYAFAMLIGLILLRPGFIGQGRGWWTASLLIQSWHFVEHSALQIQALVGANLFGAKVPTSFLQVFFPRPELHLFYNAAVFIPMVVAMLLHTRNKEPMACTCAH